MINGVLDADWSDSLRAVRRLAGANRGYAQLAVGCALEPSGLLPSIPLETVGRAGSPMRGPAMLLFLDRFSTTSTILMTCV